MSKWKNAALNVAHSSVEGSKKRRVEIKGKQSERLSECRSPLPKVAGERGGEKRRVFDAEERKGGTREEERNRAKTNVGAISAPSHFCLIVDSICDS